jgi:cardiolipin synthase (CMP-forming)
VSYRREDRDFTPTNPSISSTAACVAVTAAASRCHHHQSLVYIHPPICKLSDLIVRPLLSLLVIVRQVMSRFILHQKSSRLHLEVLDLLSRRQQNKKMMMMMTMRVGSIRGVRRPLSATSGAGYGNSARKVMNTSCPHHQSALKHNKTLSSWSWLSSNDDVFMGGRYVDGIDSYLLDRRYTRKGKRDTQHDEVNNRNNDFSGRISVRWVSNRVDTKTKTKHKEDGIEEGVTSISRSSSIHDDDDDAPASKLSISSPPTVWEQVQSVPNIITLTRLASTPVLCYWIIQGDYYLATCGFVAAALSDGLDGYLAKYHGGGTVLGTYLDPLADKVLVNSLGVSLWYAGILPTPLVIVWAMKDIILFCGTGWYLYQEQHTVNFVSNSAGTKPLTVTPTVLGKASTGLQFATLSVGILSPVVGPDVLPPEVLHNLCWITGFTTVASVLSYTGRSGFKVERSSDEDQSEHHETKEKKKS